MCSKLRTKWGLNFFDHGAILPSLKRSKFYCPLGYVTDGMEYSYRILNKRVTSEWYVYPVFSQKKRKKVNDMSIQYSATKNNWSSRQYWILIKEIATNTEIIQQFFIPLSPMYFNKGHRLCYLSCEWPLEKSEKFLSATSTTNW